MVRIAGNTLRGIFALNLILGILFWTGNEPGPLVAIHMLLGIIFVLTLWYVSVVYALRGGPIGIQVGAFAVGVIIAIVGLFQRSWLPGPNHWLIQALHLLLALLGIGLAEMMGARYKRVAAARV